MLDQLQDRSYEANQSVSAARPKFSAHRGELPFGRCFSAVTFFDLAVTQ